MTNEVQALSVLAYAWYLEDGYLCMTNHAVSTEGRQVINLCDHTTATAQIAALTARVAELEGIESSLSSIVRAVDAKCAELELELRAERSAKEGYARILEANKEHDKELFYRAAAAEARCEELADAAREALIDAACFAFWVREAAQAPGSMAKLIANCVTEEDYRAAIMPCIVQGNAAIDAALLKEQP